MTEDSTTLSVLETLAEAADLPQRQIAARTGLNLAKVNFVIRALADKGYIKLKRVRENPHKWRYLYLLTPEGVSAKSRLAYRFLQRTLRQYASMEERVEARLAALSARGVRRVALWGCTEITELCTRVLARSDDLHLVGVVDPCGQTHRALTPEQLASLDLDAIVVCEPEARELPEGVDVVYLL